MRAGDPQVAVATDGFPYFMLHADPAGGYSVDHVLEFCTTGGYGVIVHDRAGAPQWRFTYGELWALRAPGVALPAWAAAVLDTVLGHLAAEGRPSVVDGRLVVPPSSDPDVQGALAWFLPPG